MNIVSIEDVKGFTILITRSIDSIFHFELIDTKGEVYCCTCEFLTAKDARLMADIIIEHEYKTKDNSSL